MIVVGKVTVIGITTISLVLSALSGINCRYNPQTFKSYNEMDILDSENESGAVPGRVVSVPVKVYKNAFKMTLKLGQCPLVMKEGSIKTCKDAFEGESVYLAKGSTVVDVSRVKSSEDILSHVMGGIGASIGVLGLASVSAKVNVAVSTETSRNTLNLLSSYEVTKGVLTLHHPRVKDLEGDSALFLSEIELGGNELFLVTLEFESEKEKVEVEASVTLKILFISITAKLNYVHDKFNSKASCTIQLKSSWREDITTYYSSLETCIPKVKELEDKYMKGPQELREMASDDERLHSFYHFSSWKRSPYGSQFNLALINHDLEFLTEQNTEIKAVIQRINKLKDQYRPSDIRDKMLKLNDTLTDKMLELRKGLDTYHQISPDERQKLHGIYGHNKAPLYYNRRLEKIITQ